MYAQSPTAGGRTMAKDKLKMRPKGAGGDRSASTTPPSSDETVAEATSASTAATATATTTATSSAGTPAEESAPSAQTPSPEAERTESPPSKGADDAAMPPSPSPNESSACSLCLERGAAENLLTCQCCSNVFHAQCAKLPQTPEEGEFFCRWSCFTTFRKRQEAEPKAPLSDLPLLAARVQSIMEELPRRSSHRHAAVGMERGREDGVGDARRFRERRRSLPPTNGRSRSASPFHGVAEGEVGSGRLSNGHARDGIRSRKTPPPLDRAAGGNHIDLTQEEPESPRVRSARGMPRSADGALGDEPEEMRKHRRLRYADAPPNGQRGGSHRGTYTPPVSQSGAPPGGFRGGPAPDGLGYRQRDHAALPAMYEHRHPPGQLPPSIPVGTVPPASRMHAFEGTTGRTRPSSASQEIYDGRPPSEHSSRRSSRGSRAPAEPFVEPARGFPPASNAGVRGPPAPSPSGSTKSNIPWLNPSAFPSSLIDRFNCQPDNANGVFRIDLSPVFADRTMHLFQTEIDFFFRCFESSDVSLIVKGMASELNQYLWAWPFILESCSGEALFSFDHFQFRHVPGEHPELEYVGELRLSMPAYNAYLERYLSGSMSKDVVVLEDHNSKKPISLVATENIIALNGLPIAEHCTQLHNDLIKSFQWDLFAGGIHCLLQYLPQHSRDKRFSSPLLHFNFPGGRGRLQDPGNGTTDHAYQVLSGALELVIFERLEPKDRDEFQRVLRRAGYNAEKKPMLLDSHLRCLRDAGFAWSTVLLTDGDFVHVNKGRLHFWRVVEPELMRGPVSAPCVFLSWEWVYQGVSQRGISTECWFAMKNATLCSGGWAFDPRRAIVEAAKCGVSIVRTGQFLNSLAGPGAPPVLLQLAFSGTPASIDREVVSQREEQMVLFLESILPCMDAIVEEEFELGLVKDDSEDFRKMFDDEMMWKIVDTSLSRANATDLRDYHCGICGLELTNIYKQCLGCTVHARRRRPNMEYKTFRICLRCHAQPEHHLFKPRAIHGYFERLCSSDGHTGLLPATRRYQAERSYFKCRCTPYVRCTYCGGCESCCCLCHTLFQTRFRYTAPEHLDHLRTDVVEVIKWHKHHH
ncbi:hypothetical protein Poli38472_013499 [Pythium oligandrum]|uniref:Zinc finger PHD-type domain-containing protein n=1 Tax=Pythium oligandrum TaxID=41045 RepID=A0A8K1C845_PYTOL|nr:hypothetical protein Poli38472_013499 [Pythium oligandrum]|eukprot:TMW58025.1 hypothetical protein Poli38472_013499 [Pythium oligandrum]